jgi:Domain of unknown function
MMDDGRLTRRELLALLGAGAVAAMVPGSQIIVNERTSGTMLDVPMDVPTLVGNPRDLVRHVRARPGEALRFETVGLGHPADVQFAPFYQLAHERYNLYWKVVEA